MKYRQSSNAIKSKDMTYHVIDKLLSDDNRYVNLKVSKIRPFEQLEFELFVKSVEGWNEQNSITIHYKDSGIRIQPHNTNDKFFRRDHHLRKNGIQTCKYIDKDFIFDFTYHVIASKYVLDGKIYDKIDIVDDNKTFAYLKELTIDNSSQRYSGRLSISLDGDERYSALNIMHRQDNDVSKFKFVYSKYEGNDTKYISPNTKRHKEKYQLGYYLLTKAIYLFLKDLKEDLQCYQKKR